MMKHYVAFQAWLACQKQKKVKGQSLAEYGLILALIAMACIVALTTLGDSIGTMLNELAGEMSNVNTTAR